MKTIKNNSKFYTENNLVASLLEYIIFLLGCLIVAISFNTLLLPNKIASGGVMGISILTETLWSINPAYVQWAVNIPIFIAGIVTLGKKSAVKSAVGSVALPFFILLTQTMNPLTLNPLLGSLYGGLGLGLGLGLVFRSRGSTGGFSIISLILQKYTHITIGTAAMVLDGIVIVLAGFIINPENALYALIVVYVMSKTIDMIQIGFNFSKIVFVISEAHEEITKMIFQEISRGVTKVQATGGYSSRERPMLMIVINQSELTRIKQLIQREDPNAFMVISNAHEVMGTGFSSKKPVSTVTL